MKRELYTKNFKNGKEIKVPISKYQKDLKWSKRRVIKTLKELNYEIYYGFIF